MAAIYCLAGEGVSTCCFKCRPSSRSAGSRRLRRGWFSVHRGASWQAAASTETPPLPLRTRMPIPAACAAAASRVRRRVRRARGGRARRQFAVTGARQATSYGSQGARHAPITGCRPHAARVRDRLRSTPACAGLPPSAGLFIGRPGSIPACAGLPSVRAGASCAMAVYPTCAGCHVHPHTEPGIVEATPTCAGLLRRRTRVASGRWSHPRVCGAAPGCLAHEWFHAGLPPRVHGATADPRVRGAAGVQKVLPRRRQSVSPRARGCRG